MKTLPNGVTIFNATPHTCPFWCEAWEDVFEVESDTMVSAVPEEVPAEAPVILSGGAVRALERAQVIFVSTKFVGTDEGWDTIRAAFRDGADVVVGSIIAAQAYPGLVVGMTPSPGYERVPPADKRMRPDKFTVF